MGNWAAYTVLLCSKATLDMFCTPALHLNDLSHFHIIGKTPNYHFFHAFLLLYEMNFNRFRLEQSFFPTSKLTGSSAS